MIDPKKLTYAIALWFFNILADLFFREIRARGSHRIPTDAATIFVVAPHANQVSRKLKTIDGLLYVSFPYLLFIYLFGSL